jgi:DNA-binding winged helix-turn-helix (wHTH) protein
MRTRLLIVATDLNLRASLIGLLRGAGYAPELAEPAARAHLRDNRGIAIALLAPEGLGAARDTIIGALEASIGNVLLLATNDGPRLPGRETIDATDQTALLARVGALLAKRPSEAPPPPVLRFADFHFDLAGEILLRGDGTEVRLTSGEFRLLRAFAERPRRVLSREQLLQATKGGDADTDRGIDMLLVRLRRKIERDPRNPAIIVTVPGSGYKFAHAVEKLDALPERTSLPAAGDPVPAGAAARRRVTVLCAELVARAGHRLPEDPEKLAPIVAAHRHRVGAIAARFGGVAGAGFMRTVPVYFGYPAALEHASEWAVAAGLEIADGAAQLISAPHTETTARVGIVAGLVMAAADGEIIGAAPEAALELQGLAAPGEVLIGPEVRRTIGGLFRCRALPPERGDRARQAWRVVGRGPMHNRFRALHRDAVPMVGREEEIELLQRRWAQARDGDGRVVWIVGEAGIGKSRLTRALVARCEDAGALRLCLDCTPRHAESALHPLINLLERVAPSFGADEACGEARLARLRRQLSPAEPSEAEIGALAGLLGLGPETPPEASPQARKARVFATVLALLVRLCDRRPVMVVCEDVHWADSLSLELLELVCCDIAELPVLLLVTSRPEFSPTWGDAAHVTTLKLNRLSRHEAALLAENVAAGRPLVAEMTDRILAHTDGVPLFVEELTRAVLESGAASQAMERLHLGVPLDVPATLHDSLMVRLDRLGWARELAQCAAVLGNDFAQPVLAAVAGLEAERLEAGLALLTAARLVARNFVGSTYSFQHALIRDAAYGTIVHERRRALHRQIAETLERDFADDAAAQPQQLALHYTEAGLERQAASWWLRAGLQSLQRSAMTEALAQLRRALALLEALPNDVKRQRIELEALVVYGKALIATQGHAAEATGAAFARARALCNQLGDPPQVLTVLFTQWTHAFFRVRLSEAEERASDLLQRAAESGDPVWLVMGHYTFGFTSLLSGNINGAIALLTEGIARFDPAHRHLYAGPTIGDPRVVMRSYLGWGLMMRGAFSDAERQLDTTVQEARDLRQPWVLALALAQQIHELLSIRGADAAASRIDELAHIAEGVDYYAAVARIWQGWLLAARGDLSAGLIAAREGRNRQLATGTRLHVPCFLRAEAEMLLKMGRAAEALECIEHGKQVQTESGEHWDDCEFHRQRGETYLALGQIAAAELELLAARQVSAQRGQHLFGLRAAISLAELLAARGDAPRADAALCEARALVENDTAVLDVAAADRLLTQLKAAA